MTLNIASLSLSHIQSSLYIRTSNNTFPNRNDEDSAAYKLGLWAARCDFISLAHVPVNKFQSISRSLYTYKYIYTIYILCITYPSKPNRRSPPMKQPRGEFNSIRFETSAKPLLAYHTCLMRNISTTQRQHPLIIILITRFTCQPSAILSKLYNIITDELL